MQHVCSVSVRKPTEKRSLGKPRHGWKDNIRVGIKGIWCEDMDWIYLAEDDVLQQVLVTVVMNLQSFVEGREFLEDLSSSQNELSSMQHSFIVMHVA